MAQKKSIGVLGTGGMGERHIKTLAARPDVALTALCDLRVEAAQKLAGRLNLGDVRIFSDWRKMLADARLDALYIVLPPFAHSGEVEAAAAKGIHIFIEKPIALDPAAARSMVEAVEKAGVASQVGFHFRFSKGVRALKSLMEKQTAGRPTLFEGRYWCNMFGSDWWRDPRRSGGQIVEQVIHLYDLALHLLGPAKLATGLTAKLTRLDKPEYKIEDTSSATVQFASGALAAISASNAALPMHFHASWRVVCERAALEYHTTGQPWVTPDRSQLFQYGVGEKPDDVQQTDFPESDDLVAAETDAFLQAIDQRRPTLTPIRDGLAALELVLAVVASANAQGKPVMIG